MARNHSGCMKHGKPIIADKIFGFGWQIPGQKSGPNPDFRYKWLLMDIKLAQFYIFSICKKHIRPNTTSAGIDLPYLMHPKWFLAIYAFYRSKKYQIGPIFWQFIRKIGDGAQILTLDLSPKTQHYICGYLCAMFHASWVISSHICLLQFEKISNWSDFLAIYT